MGILDFSTLSIFKERPLFFAITPVADRATSDGTEQDITMPGDYD